MLHNPYQLADRFQRNLTWKSIGAFDNDRDPKRPSIATATPGSLVGREPCFRGVYGGSQQKKSG